MGYKGALAAGFPRVKYIKLSSIRDMVTVESHLIPLPGHMWRFPPDLCGI